MNLKLTFSNINPFFTMTFTQNRDRLKTLLLLLNSFLITNGDSLQVFSSDNSHAERMRATVDLFRGPYSIVRLSNTISIARWYVPLKVLWCIMESSEANVLIPGTAVLSVMRRAMK